MASTLGSLAPRMGVGGGGANAWPVPGVGSFAYALSPALLLCFRASGFTSKGLVALGDLPAFLETNSGMSAAKDHLTIVDLRGATRLAWIPYGFLVSPLVLVDDDQDGDGASTAKSSKDHGDLGFIWTMSLFDASLAAAVPDSVWGPIETMNQEHFAARGDVPLWSTRSEVFQTVSRRTT